jgi:hypothetical protein
MTAARCVRVEDWRADIRLRWQFHRFRGGPQSGCHHHVSSPRHIERSVRISRTTLTCLLRAKAYETYPAERTFRRSCVLHHSQPKLWRFQVTPEAPTRFSLHFGVYLPSQVLQTNGRRCHLALASRIAGRVTNSRAPSLCGRYSASPLLRTRPTPSRLRPLSRVAGYTAYLAPPISRRDEEGLSSCLARPCHHAVDNHPAGVAHRISPFAMIHAAFAGSLPARPPGLQTFEATSRSLALRPGDSPPSLRWRCR